MLTPIQSIDTDYIVGSQAAPPARTLSTILLIGGGKPSSSFFLSCFKPSFSSTSTGCSRFSFFSPLRQCMASAAAARKAQPNPAVRPIKAFRTRTSDGSEEVQSPDDKAPAVEELELVVVAEAALVDVVRVALSSAAHSTSPPGTWTAKVALPSVQQLRAALS